MRRHPEVTVVNRGVGFAMALAALGAAAAMAYADVMTRLVRDWTVDGDYSHGFLVAPLAVYFAWQRRRDLSRAELKASGLGLVIVIGGLLLLGVGTLGAELFLARVSLLIVIAGSVLYVWGRRHLGLLTFPLVLLLTVVPLPVILLNEVTVPLQFVASQFGVTALEYLSIPVLREGNVIVLPHTALEVAEACSGIRSLTALIALAMVYGMFTHGSATACALLVLAATPVAVVANGLRVAGTGVAAYYYGPAAAQAFFHAFSGWLMFVIGLALLLGGDRLVRAPAYRSAAARSKQAACAVTLRGATGHERGGT